MPSTASADPPKPAVDPAPMHACVRCGTPIPIADGMCERCNPLGLRQPAASQAHGTVFVGIVGAVIALAIAGRMVLSGIGPFSGQVTDVQSTDIGLSLTLSVANQGTKAGSVTCRVYDPTTTAFGPEAAYVQSPEIPPGISASFTRQVTTLGIEPRPLAAECGR